MSDVGGRRSSGDRRGDPYAGIPGRRLFVAVPLPGPASAAVVDVVDAVRAAGLPDGMHDVRWVRLDGLHLTLRFLGPTPEDRIGPTIDAVHAATAGPGAPGPFEIELGGAGAFPEHGRPRTIWIGLTAGVHELDALSARLGHALTAAGWAPDDRPFRPHLTLARSDGLAAGPIVAQRLSSAMTGRSIGSVADRIVLYESQTGGGPARYVPLATSLLERAPGIDPGVYHPPVS